MKRVLQTLLSCLMMVSCVVLPVYAKENLVVIEDSVTTSNNEAFKFQYSDGWSAGKSSVFSNGDEHYGYAGAWVELKFTGTMVAIYGTKAPQHGSYDVYLDGAYVETVDAYATSRINQQLLYQSATLDGEEHILRLELPKNVTSGTAIQIDYAEVVTGELKPTAISLSESMLVLEKGKSQTLAVNVTPSLASVDGLVWSSDNEAVVTVENGVVTAKKDTGSATIIVMTTDGTLFDTCVVQAVPVVEVLSAYVADTDVSDLQSMYDDIKTKMSFTFSDIVWRGDVSLSRIALVTREDVVHNVTFSASDLTSEDATIPASAFDIRWLKDVNANIGRGNSNAPVVAYPDVIHKGGSITIPAQYVQSAWINLNIPKDAKAGIYQGTLTLSADELETPYEFTYTIEVLDLVQPSMQDVDSQIQIWQHPFSVANYYGLSESEYFTTKHFDYLRGETLEQVAMGSRDVVANIVEEAWNHQSYYGDPSMVKWTKKSNGTWEFDYTWYDAWVNFNIECGMLEPENGVGAIKCYSIVPWNNQVKYYDEAKGQYVNNSYTPGSDAWTQIWTPFLTDFMQHSVEKGWLDITYIAMDERGLDQLRPAVELLERITTQDGKQFKIFSAFNYNGSEDYSFTDRIDDISIAIGNVSHSSDTMRKLCEHRKSLGLTTTIYTCTGHYPSNYIISDPIDPNYVVWYTMCQSADGFMRWAWDNWVSDPLNNPNYKYWEPGDGWFIYPTEKNEVSVTYYYSTPRYEMLKQALRDTSKAKYLMSISDELYQEVQTLVQSMGRGSQGSNGYGSATYANETARQTTINEANRMREGVLTISQDYLENGTTNINKQSLRALITKVQSAYNAANQYSTTTYAPFKTAYETAQSILTSSDATQDEIDAVVTLLQAKYDALEEVVLAALDPSKLINTSAQSAVQVIDYSSQCIAGGRPNEDAEATYVLDYDTKSYWHSDYQNDLGLPQHLTFDLGAVYLLSDITFLPRQSGTNGDILKVKVWVGTDADELSEVGVYSFENNGKLLLNRTDFIRMNITSTTIAQYVKLEVLEAGGDTMNAYVSCAEVRFYGTEAGGNLNLNTTSLKSIIDLCNALDASVYYKADIDALLEMNEQAKRLLYTAQTQVEVDTMEQTLRTKYNNLRQCASSFVGQLTEKLNGLKAFENDDKTFSEAVWNKTQAYITQLEQMIANPQNYLSTDANTLISEGSTWMTQMERYEELHEIYQTLEAVLTNHAIDVYSKTELDEWMPKAEALLNNANADAQDVFTTLQVLQQIQGNIVYVPSFKQMSVVQKDYKTNKVSIELTEPQAISYVKVYRKGAEDKDYVVLKEYDFTTDALLDDTMEVYDSVKTGKVTSYYAEMTYELFGETMVETTEVYQGKTQLVGKVRLTIKQVSNTKFKLKWNGIDGATRYIVYRKRNSDSYKKVLTLGKDVREYTTSSMAAGTYQFMVKAARYDSKDRVMTNPSNAVSGKAIFTKPNLKATAKEGAVSLKWDAIEGVKYYDVYRSTKKDSKYVKVKTTTSTSCNVTSLQANKTYYFKVVGYKTYGDIEVYSPYSNVASSKVK